ncbi:MAG TPA: carbonic anhydrase [Flavobacteriia bacterium]|nr:carbonic anhydrase [Flavobacteriia bacterium]
MDKKERLQQLTPREALEKLIDGNLRFQKSEHINRDFMQEVRAFSGRQYPFAIILGCIDSRVPVEILFDQGVGDLFVTRVAGNFENNDILASMEFACKVVGSKLIMVLGHEDCGAVKAAYDNVNTGYLSSLTKKIKPAIDKTYAKGVNSTDKEEYVNATAKVNVQLTLQRIRKKSSIINTLEKKGQLLLVGAFYHLDSGSVSIIRET